MWGHHLATRAVVTAAALAWLGALAAPAALAQEPLRRSLTVFPRGDALIRETRSLPLAKGPNRVSLGDLPTTTDAQSLVVLTPGVTLLGHYGLTVTQPVGGGAGSATLTVELEARQPVSELRFAYLSQGFEWHATYTAVLAADDRFADVSGLATLSNRSGTALVGAEVQLLAGDIYRAGGGPPMPVMERAMALADVSRGIEAGEAGELHVYTLPGRIDLAPGHDRGVRLLGAGGLPAEKRYLFRQAVSFLSQGGEFPTVPVEVAYRVRRPGAETLGDAPIPAGVVRIYRPDDGGRLQMIGETQVANVPKGEDLWLPVGRAFEVTATRTQTDYQARGRNRYETAWRIALENRTSRPVTVEVVETAHGEWRIVSSSHTHERRTATTFVFQVQVPAEGEATLEYRIEVET